MVHRAPGQGPNLGTDETRAAAQLKGRAWPGSHEILVPGRLSVLGINSSRMCFKCKRVQCLDNWMLMSPDLSQGGAGRVFPGVRAELWAHKVLDKQTGCH